MPYIFYLFGVRWKNLAQVHMVHDAGEMHPFADFVGRRNLILELSFIAYYYLRNISVLIGARTLRLLWRFNGPASCLPANIGKFFAVPS